MTSHTPLPALFTHRTGNLRTKVSALLTGAALLVSAAACGSGSGGPDAGGDGLRLVAAFYPLEWLAQRVGGGDAAVTTLARPGVEPHALELSPRQIAELEQADLVIHVRGVQPALDEALAGRPPEQAFDTAGVVRTIPAGDAHDHAAEDAGAEEHAAGGPDPHVWLDPDRFAAIATELGKRLADLDPAHAAGYTERAAGVAGELTALDAEYRKGLTGCARHAVVTSHAAFGYLADRYGFEQVSISGIDPDAEPSPARLAEVAKVAKQEKVTTIFTEELVSPKVAELLATEVGAETEVLNPLESRPADGDYLSAARQNLTKLRAALGCP